jgi:hypothetical protein
MDNQVSSRHKKIFRYIILERSYILQYYIHLENARKRLPLGCVALAWLKRSAKWASRCLQNAAIPHELAGGGASLWRSCAQSLGRRKWPPLGARHRLSGRCQSHAQGSQPAELCRPATYGAQPPQTGTDGQVWHQSQAAQSWMERRLPSPSPCRLNI